jgi:hypothetical protein
MLIVVSCASTSATRANRASNQPIPATRSTSTTGPTHASTAGKTAPITSLLGSARQGWVAVSVDQSGVAIDQRTVTFADGHSIIVTRFHFGQVDFKLHVGSVDPPTGSAATGSESGPAVSSNERPLLLAAFNGGFKRSAGAGGFEVNQSVLTPLESGRASFVIDTNGVAHIGVWGDQLPFSQERVSSVLQNLAPLIIDSQPSANLANIRAWGPTLGGGAVVARSAIGEDAQGDILYAASMQALPVDLADALTAQGATSAMELDINPQWVQLDLSGTAGGSLHPGIPSQHRPADQYLVGWTADFVTVLARHA